MNTYKVGIFPDQTPRDPIQVNTFLEHVLIGQVLDTLVSADKFGQIIPGIASSWSVSKEGKKITFKIDTTMKFSNGKNVDAYDVEYSLNRHINSTSQSKSYLNSIESIKPESADSIIINLKEPRIAIFKVLSRDQLGIVPKGWIFNAKNQEPYIGTGPYRIIKENGKLQLDINSHAKAKPSIQKWDLIKSSELQAVDYLPFVTQKELDDYIEKNKIDISKYKVLEQLSFLQSSAWFYPHGLFYKDKVMKKNIMSIIGDYIDQRAKKLKFKRSTGVIPEGVAGFNNKIPDVKKQVDANSLEQLKKSGIKIAIFPSIYDEYFDHDLVREIEAKYKIKLTFLKVEMHKPNEIISQHPDVFIARWAGGFNDPEGFLAILDQILSFKFEEYLAQLGNVYEAGKKEQDWQKRSQIFRDLSKELVFQQYMIPGWKTPTYYLLNKKMKIEEINFRYTPRLSDVSEK